MSSSSHQYYCIKYLSDPDQVQTPALSVLVHFVIEYALATVCPIRDGTSHYLMCYNFQRLVHHQNY